MAKKICNYIAVDFDGTLCEHNFPEIGKPKISVIEFIKKQSALGAKIILYTCRENSEIKKDRQYLDEAVQWCKVYAIPINAVNENPFVNIGKRKIYADIYIDDRAINVGAITGEYGLRLHL